MKRPLSCLVGMVLAGSLGPAAEDTERDLRELARELSPEQSSFALFRPLFDFTEGLEFGIVHIERRGDLVSYYLGTNPRMAAYAEQTKGRSAVLGSRGAFGEMVESGIWKGSSSMSTNDGHVTECVLRFRIADRKLHENTCAGRIADTRIVAATEAGDLAEVGRLIAEGISLDQRGEKGNTALVLATAKGHPEIARLLVKGGAAVDLRAADGSNALILASYFGHTEVVADLLAAGAATDVQVKDGRTALMVAAGQGHVDIVRKLLEHGADKALKDSEGDTALEFAKDPAIRELLTP